MGSIGQLPQHQQICFSASVEKSQLVAISAANDDEKSRDEVAYQSVHASTPQPGTDPSEQDIACYPMLSEKMFVDQLRQFHEALVKAIANIVHRWWEDKDSDFPSRMPLEPQLEEILQWIDLQTKQKSMPAFADCLGLWRPDFLLTESPRSAVEAGFKVCEINSRSPNNAIIHNAYKSAIMQELLGPNSMIVPAGKADTMMDGFLNHFDLTRPIHIIRGRDTLDRQEFALLVEGKTGLRPRLIHMSDLQLRPDPSSATGFSPYWVSSEQEPEKIHQAIMSLFADEFSSLSQDMLPYLAKLAVNDFRAIALVNDQRFLGIILQELNNLVEKHKVLTPEEGQILREGIVPTFIPGSQDIQEILQKSRQEGRSLKNDFIVKAARSSRGKGHLLGDEISEEEWEAILLDMQEQKVRADTTTYVLQPYVRQPKFAIAVNKSRTVPGSQIVGTYYATNGRFAGMGPWRTGAGKICNVYGDGCVLVVSVTTVDSETTSC